MSDKYLREHLEELASRKTGAYYLLLALEENPAADEKCFAALSLLVDRATFHEIKLGDDARNGIRSFLKTRRSDLATALLAWSTAFSAVEHSRYAMGLVLARYPAWLNDVSEVGNESFRTLLPMISPQIYEMKEDGIKTLISILNSRSSADECRELVDDISVYKDASGEIILAAARVAELSFKSNTPSIVGRMAALIAPKLLETKDIRTLLPKIADVSDEVGSVDQTTRAMAVGLCFSVAEHNLSSAMHVANKIKEAFELPSDVLKAYLSAFDQIVREIGISMVGFGLKELRERFQRAGVDNALHFVDQGVSVAKRYGKTAAQDFFNQKTVAARRAAQF